MKELKRLILLAALFVAMSASASTVLSSSTCAEAKGKGLPFLLILKKDQNIHQAILRCVNAAEIDNASIHGIGAIKQVTLAFYDLKKKKYMDKLFPDIYELLALNGDVSLLKGQRMLHLHTIIGTEDYNTHGGHLVNGVIGVTGEIMITPLQGKAVRTFNDALGLNLINPKKSKG